MKIQRSFILLVCAIISFSCSKKTVDKDLNNLVAQFGQVTPYSETISGTVNKISGVSKFEIRYSASPENESAKTITLSSNIFELKGLQPATAYYLQARAYSDSKWSAWSKTKEVKTADFFLSIETYNILSSKYDNQFPGHTWAQRRLAFKEIILKEDNFPDVLAIQEAFETSQVNDVSALLKEQYNGHISSRETDARAIFWKKDKYSLVEYDDNIAGYDNTISGHSQSKYITYVRLKDKATGKNFLIFNIHPVAGSTEEASKARGVQARMIADKARALSAKYNEPAFVVGDYNNYPNSIIGGYKGSVLVIKESGFEDTFDVAGDNKTNENYSTHDNITSGQVSIGENGSKRLDYIFFYPKDRVTVSDYEIIIDFQQGSSTVLRSPIPSDHRPVRSTVHLFY